MINDEKDLKIEIDRLKGNINRMCVVNNIEELETNLAFAKIRIEDIFNYNLSRILNKKKIFIK